MTPASARKHWAFAASTFLAACADPADLARRVDSLRARRLEPDPPSFEPRDALAFLGAALFVVVPFALGVLLGRRLGPRTGLAAAFLAPLALLAAAPVLPFVAWDLLTLGVLLGLGLGMGARAGRRGWFAFGTASFAVLAALALAEAVLHDLHVPAPKLSEAPRRFQVTRAAMVDDDAFCVIAGDPGFLDARRALAPPAPREVVHLGDSMVEGVGLPASATFPGILSAREPGTRHVDAGVTGAAPDFEYVLLRRVLADPHPPAGVVVHLFPGNDASGLDMVFSCCADGPLVVEDGDGVRERCPAPSTAFSWRGAVARPVPPYPVRVAATAFDLPRHAWRLVAAFQGRFASAKAFPDRFREITASLRQMKREADARHVSLGVVVMPLREALQPGTGPQGYETTPEHARLFREAVAAAGVPWLDAEPPFRDWLAQNPGRGFLGAFPGDPHLDAAGHAAYADVVRPFVDGLVP